MTNSQTIEGRRRREIVLSARIYSRDSETNLMLRPGGEGVIGNYRADQIIAALRTTIEYDLPRDIRALFNIKVKTRVIDVREGSVIIYFGAIVSGIGLLASYKSLCESIALLKDHLRYLVGARMQRDFPHIPDEIEMDVNVQYPHLDRPGDWHWPWRRLMRDPEGEMLASMMMGAGDPLTPRRDAFFWFLLILSILQGVALVLLVWRAVVHTYF